MAERVDVVEIRMPWALSLIKLTIDVLGQALRCGLIQCAKSLTLRAFPLAFDSRFARAVPPTGGFLQLESRA